MAEWIEPEPRLRGTITVMAEDADGAVAEIERCAKMKGFAQVALVTRPIEPLGRKRYWRIYEAAAHHGLPLGLHNSGNNGHAVTAGGAPSFYFEEHQAVSMSLHAMVTSFIIEGVPEHLPELKIVVVEGGFAWAAPLAWRMDGAVRPLPWRSSLPEDEALRIPAAQLLVDHAANGGAGEA